MPYRLAALLALLLFAVTSAQAQLLITDPARAAAARDSLLHEAQRLRLLATQNTREFSTNARRRSPRRVRVRGTFIPVPVVTTRTVLGRDEPSCITWRHITRYRRNGRVQEKFCIMQDERVLLNERRLNGTVRWLALPQPFGTAMGQPLRQSGLYLQTGYLVCNGVGYVLPPPVAP